MNPHFLPPGTGKNLRGHWIGFTERPYLGYLGTHRARTETCFSTLRKANKQKYPKQLLVFQAHSFGLFSWPVLRRLQALSSQNAPTIHSFKQVWDGPWGCGREDIDPGEGARVPLGSISPALIAASVWFARAKGEHCPDQAGPPARELNVRLSPPGHLKRGF